ncbi:hypothetical protein GALL_159290 [mine drainage metagenome]|uniref:DUF3253 domain-containing protein n=1 Tax=mine drainage metagenome TaxID=410659 RepID=A0A1J5SPT3_9ZZZZ
MSEKKEDPIRLFLLSALADGSLKAPHELARAFHATRAKPSDGPSAWRRYMNAIKQQATFMARSGALMFVRKGEPIHPDDVKGVVKLRLPLPGEAMPAPKPRDDDMWDGEDDGE